MTSRYKGYKSGSGGWFKEPTRHSLASQGIRTGRKADYSLHAGYTPKQPEVAYGGTTISTPPVPKELTEQEVMPDAEAIVSSSEDRMIEDYEQPSLLDATNVGYGDTTTDTKSSIDKSPFRQRTDDDVAALEAESEPQGLIPEQPWYERFRDRVKESYANLQQSIKDGDESGITEHLAKLKNHRTELSEKIDAINRLKSDLQSDEYRHEAGIAEQLTQLKKVNKLLAEPDVELAKLGATISQLEGRRSSLVRTRMMSPEERARLQAQKKSESILPSLNPFSWQKDLDEALAEKEYRQSSRPVVVRSVPEKRLSVFPSFDEIIHPEKVIGKKIDFSKKRGL